MDWSPLYPKFVNDKDPNNIDVLKNLNRFVTIADIGCGFGGLLMALSPMMTEELLIGFYPSSWSFSC